MKRNRGCNAVSLNWQTWARTPRPCFLAASKIFSVSSARERSAVGEYVHELRQLSVRPPAESSVRKPSRHIPARGREIPWGQHARPAGLRSPFPAISRLRRWMASSDLISESTVNPYPDLASTVVVPCSAISCSASSTLSTSSFLPALRTPSRLERIPPPASAICFVGRAGDALLKIHQPRSQRIRDGCASPRIRAGQLCPAQSISTIFLRFFLIQGSRSASLVLQAETIFPPEHRTAPSLMMPSSCSSGPRRGPEFRKKSAASAAG